MARLFLALCVFAIVSSVSFGHSVSGRGGILTEAGGDELVRAFLPHVARLTLGVLEASRRKAPCVCAGMCTESESSDSSCQVCQMYMGHFHAVVDRLVAPEENSGVFRAVAQKLSVMNDQELLQHTKSAANLACLRAKMELESVSGSSEFNTALPHDGKYKAMLKVVVSQCETGQFAERVGCIGGHQYLKIIQKTFLAAEPAWDQAKTAHQVTSRFLNSILGKKKLNPNSLIRAASKMAAPNFVPARLKFNAVLCELAGIESNCGLSSQAMVHDAGHRKVPLLAPVYADVFSELLHFSKKHALPSALSLEMESNALEISTLREHHHASKKHQHALEAYGYETACAIGRAVKVNAQEFIEEITDPRFIQEQINDAIIGEVDF